MSRQFKKSLSFILIMVMFLSTLGIDMAFAENQNKVYTMEELSRLGNSQLIDVLSNTHYENIEGLFSYSDAAYRIYNDEYKMDALRNALVQKGREYTKDDDKGIPTIVEFLRSGYYLGFYNDSLSHLNKRENKDKCIPAILSIQNNPNFKLGTKTQDGVVHAAAMMVNNASSNVEVVNNFTAILKDFNNNLESYEKEKSKGDAMFNILNGVQYDLNNYTKYEHNNSPEDSPWFGRIDGFIEEVTKIATIPYITDNGTDWMINNGIYGIATLGLYHNDREIGNRTLTKAMNQYEKYSEPYLRAALGIAENYKGIDYEGQKVDFNKLKEEAEQVYYGKIYTFDDGNFIIRAGDKVREDKILRLYWAAKEVEAQFFRTIGDDKPLEEGNADDVLTMIIYNNPSEYRLNSVLNGLDTENGGMYIEGDGTFYTYERTRQDSVYTLEELFRHEFTHYLQGRYVAPGMWGSSDFYKNERLTWYEEGGAEYFAGSTRTEGVKPRKTMVGNILNVPESNRYSLNQVLNSKYSSGFDFYNYAYMFMTYANKENPEVYNKLTNYVRANDIRGFDNYVNTLKSNYQMDREYRESMDRMIKDYDNLDTPLVSDRYLAHHEEKDINEILSEIKTTTGLTDLKVDTQKSEHFNTFTIEGTYNGGSWYQGELRDSQNMTKVLDEMLTDLSKLEWSGYDTFTAYFKNYRLDSNYNFVYDVVFHGIQSGDEFVIDPEDIGEAHPVIEIIGNKVTMEHTRFTGYKSTSDNGDILEYKWLIDGKEYDGSYVDIMFEKPGEYDVKLTIKDELGVVGEASEKLVIEKREEPSNPEIPEEPSEEKLEKEPNDSYENANLLLNGIVGETNVDDTDWFYFDIDEAGYYDLKLNQLSGNESTFVVHMEGNYDYTIYYPTKVNGSCQR